MEIYYSVCQTQKIALYLFINEHKQGIQLQNDYKNKTTSNKIRLPFSEKQLLISSFTYK